MPLVVGGLAMLLILTGILLVGGRRVLVPTGTPTPSGAPSGTDNCFARSGGGGGATQPNPKPGPEYPRTEGQVGRQSPMVVSGSGKAELHYTRTEEVPTVLEFDCPECRGPLQVYNYGGHAMVVSGSDVTGVPVHTIWLLDTEQQKTLGTRNQLLVNADGRWTMTLRSSRDLARSTAPISGQDSQVLAAGSSRARFSLDPLNSTDKLIIEGFDYSGKLLTSACIGRRESREISLGGAQLILVNARGEWKVEPL